MDTMILSQIDQAMIDLDKIEKKAMSAYSYEIVQTLVVDIEPDENVKRAMNEINAAARMRVSANEKAQAEKILQAIWG